MSSKFVYVKLSHKKSSAPKKVIMPSTLAGLKKSVTKAFDLNEPIGAFKNQQDEVIDDVHNIFEGSLILVVLKSRMDRDGNSSTANSVASSTASSLKLSINKEKPKLLLSINNSSNVNKSNAAGSNANSSKSQTPTVKSNNSYKVKLNTPKSSKTPNQRQVNEKQVIQNNEYEDDDYENSSDDLDDEQKDDEYEAATEGEELFKLITPNCKGEFAESVNEAFLDLSSETNDFLTQALKIEYIQKSRYFNQIQSVCKSYGMFDYNEDWIHLDKMQKKARSLISNKRIPTTGGYTYVMKTAILGPNNCGKSTFIYVYLRELLIDLIATDTWKSVFIFPYDISEFMEGMVDKKYFYKRYVEYIFELLQVQCPSMIPLLPSIEKCFENVTEMKGHVALPRRLTQDIQLKRLASAIDEIVQSLAQIWIGPDLFECWLANLALLPKRLASAFGFKQIINVFDHFDCSNECVCPGRPFEKSEFSCFPSEILKCALVQGPFVLGAKNSLHFFDSLQSIDDKITVNIASYIDSFYLWNLIDQTLYNDKEIYVEFMKTKAQLKITSYACGGIPNYLVKWNKMNEFFDELEKLEENTPEYEDAYCELVTIIETIVYDLFVPETRRMSEKFEKTPVADVRRRTIKQA